MFGRRNKSAKRSTRVVHSDRCTALHEAMLMNLYCSYGAASTPLFIPSGSLMCSCGGDKPETPETPTATSIVTPNTDANARKLLTFA